MRHFGYFVISTMEFSVIAILKMVMVMALPRNRHVGNGKIEFFTSNGNKFGRKANLHSHTHTHAYIDMDDNTERYEYERHTKKMEKRDMVCVEINNKMHTTDVVLAMHV